MIEVALLTLLTDTSAGARIYPLVIPFKTDLPALTYQRITDAGHHDIDVSHPRVQITAWSDRLLEARHLAAEVEGRLQRYKGVLPGFRVKQIVKLPSPGDIFDRDARTENVDTGLYYIPTDYRIIYMKE